MIKKSLRSLINRLQDLLEDPPSPEAPPAPVRASTAPAPEALAGVVADAPERSIDGRIEAKLAEALHRRESMVTGLVYLISLERVISYIRSRKPYMLEKTFQVAESVLRSELGHDDFFAKYRETGFLVAYAHLSREAAQLKSSLLGRLIAEHLVGAEAAAELAVTHQVSFGDDNRLSFKELPSIEGIGDFFVGSGAKQEETKEKRKRRDPEWVYDSPGADFRDAVLFRIEFRYLPVWVAETHQITNYIWQPSLISGGRDAVAWEYDVLPHKNWSKEIRELDLYSLNAFRIRMSEAREDGNAEPLRNLFTLVLHYETLVSSKGRFQFLQVGHALPPEIRRRIVFEIVGLPEGVVNARLLELLAMLRPLGRSALFRLPLGHRGMPDLHDSFLYAVGVEMPQAEDEDERVAQRDALLEHVQAAHKRGLKTYAIRVPSATAAQEALSMGFDFLAGPGILGAMERAPGPMRFELGADAPLPEGTS